MSYDGTYPDYTKRMVSNENIKVVRFKCPQGSHFMKKYRGFKSYYERKFDSLRWINSL